MFPSPPSHASQSTRRQAPSTSTPTQPLPPIMTLKEESLTAISLAARTDPNEQ